jgi:hypothetical protein
MIYVSGGMVETSRREVPAMKRKIILLVLAFLFAAGWAFFPQIVQAELEWKILKDLDLKAAPLDIAPSADGRWLFILTLGEILVYSLREGKVIDRTPVDRDFDRIASSPRADILSLTSSTKRTVRMIAFTFIHPIDVTGLYPKGPPDAPVIVAVFTDYQ